MKNYNKIFKERKWIIKKQIVPKPKPELPKSISFCITVKDRSIFEYDGKIYELLPKCINKLLTIIGPSDEIIITDWNSTDYPIETLTHNQIKIIKIDKDGFSRGHGLNKCAEYSNNDILFFMDSDFLIDKQALNHAKNVKLNTVSFPIVNRLKQDQSARGAETNWASKGYGTCIIHKSDFIKTDKWPEYYKWGKEDKHFYKKIRKQFTIIREYSTIDHIWHPSRFMITSSEFKIKARYRHRKSTKYFNDTRNTDKWQKAVYEYANRIVPNNGSVLDFGCGSGYKLMNMFNDSIYRVGVDIEPTLTWLHKKYPKSKFVSQDDIPNRFYDVVICADVIEHVLNPDELMDNLESINFGKLIISTPDRKLIYGYDHNGPPKNKSHVREWTFDEFLNYISTRNLKINMHVIIDPKQFTQMVVLSRQH